MSAHSSDMSNDKDDDDDSQTWKQHAARCISDELPTLPLSTRHRSKVNEHRVCCMPVTCD